MIISSFVKFFEKPKKTSYLKNNKRFSCHIQRQDLQPPESTLTDSNNMIEISKLLEFFNIQVFLKILKKIIKNVISQKLHGFEQSYWAINFATPESTLTESHYRDGVFKFC